MAGLRKQPVWIVPLLLAGLVAVSGAWGNKRLRQMIEGELEADLTAALDADVMALEIWATNQTKLAASLAEEPQALAVALRLLEESERTENGGRRLAASPEAEEFSGLLAPRLKRVGYEVAQLVNTNYQVLEVVGPSARRGRPRPNMQVPDEHMAKFAELFSSGQPVIITPFKPRRPPPRRPFGEGPGFPRAGFMRGPETRGEPRGVPTNGPPRMDRPGRMIPMRFGRPDMALMQVAAPLPDAQGVPRGALALVINPDAEFTRILSVARTGRSGETYAFDQHGLMVSRSRFDDQLKTLGLIEDRPGASSALTLRLGDPGGDLSKGFRPTDTNPTNWPLTRIAAAALAGGSTGVEVKPARDYRGVPVVGAWRWLPRLGLGVATQVNAAEAFESLRVLQTLFLGLFLMLVLCASAMFLFSYRSVVWRRQLTEASLRIKQLGQYTLEERIGEGGMGVVFRARHALMRRDTAVKLLLPGRSDPAALQRFEREVNLTCQLTHPNTIQVYDYGHTPDGVFYYAMEYLRGLNLHQLVSRFGPQPEARVIRILTQVCDALAEAHALGLVHRDIKPANVFLCHRGGVPDWVKVLDFGLVREFRDRSQDATHVTGEKPMMGTPAFMPPEAIKNASRSDPRSDIYSVGALAYYLLTGQKVFEADSILELYDKHLTQSPIRPSQRVRQPISPELEETVMRCLDKEPNLRPQSAAELRALLLTSPQALAWGPEAQSAWWMAYASQASGVSAPPSTGTSDPLVATVKIDLAGRVG